MTGTGGTGGIDSGNERTDGAAGSLDVPLAGTTGAGGVAGTGGIASTDGGVATGGSTGAGGAGAGGTGSGGNTTIGCQSLADCVATKVCNSGNCVPAQGLVVLTVPLSASGQDQRYWYPFNPAADLTDKTVTLRAYAPGATDGVFNIYLSMNDANSTPGSGAAVALSDLGKGWKDIAFNVGGAAGTFNPAQIKQVTIEVVSTGSGPWTNPTVVYIDSLLVSGLPSGSTFDTSVEGVMQSSVQTVLGATLAWAEGVP